MKSTITLQATPNAWLINSVLAPHLDAFTAHLQSGRYAVNTTRSYVAGIAHFAYWMTQSNLPVQVLDEHAVERFLIDHLPRCDCPTPVMRSYRDLRGRTWPLAPRTSPTRCNRCASCANWLHRRGAISLRPVYVQGTRIKCGHTPRMVTYRKATAIVQVSQWSHRI